MGQFLFAFRLCMGVDVACHSFPVDFRGVAALPEVFADLADTTCSWLPVFPLHRLEVRFCGVWLSRGGWPARRFDPGDPSVDAGGGILPHGVGDMGIDVQCGG